MNIIVPFLLIMSVTESHNTEGTLCNGTMNFSNQDVTITETTEVWRTLMAVYLGAILFLSLTFNGTLCLLFYKKAHLLSISNCFVLNLTACQLCISIFLMPFSLFAIVSQDFEYTGTWCNVQGFLFTVFIVTQQLALLIISLDRNYAIMNSLRYPNVFTQTLCIIMITFSWLFAITMCAPPLIDSGMGRYVYHKNYFVCTLDWTNNSGYLISFSSLVFGLPIAIQSLCYIKIFMAAVGHTKRSAKVNPWINRSSRTQTQVESEMSTGSSSGSMEGNSMNSSMECKAVRTILIIALAFGICWLPYFVESFMTLNGKKVSPTFSAAAICFLFSTGILNPLIYAYMNRVTRREIGRFVCGNGPATDSDEMVSTSMSTHYTNWSSQNRHRSRSLGGTVNNEMHTIIEENEDSCYHENTARRHDNIRNKGDLTPPRRCSKMEYVSPGRSSISHTEQIIVHTDSEGNTAKNNTDIIVGTSASTKTDGKPPTDTKEKTVSIGSTHIIEDSHFTTQVINNEQYKHERRRSSAKQSADSYFSQQKRRKKRDCGSFLYFEHVAEHGAASVGAQHGRKHSSQKHRPERFSVDHVHSISLGRYPSFMELKLSLNKADLKSINKVTVQSNVEIENSLNKCESGAKTDVNRCDPGAGQCNKNTTPGLQSPSLTTETRQSDTSARNNRAYSNNDIQTTDTNKHKRHLLKQTSMSSCKPSAVISLPQVVELDRSFPTPFERQARRHNSEPPAIGFSNITRLDMQPQFSTKPPSPKDVFEHPNAIRTNSDNTDPIDKYLD